MARIAKHRIWKYGLLFFIVTEYSLLLPGQTCLSAGIHLSTQEQIDRFVVDHPSCTTIAGDLLIEEASPGAITKLDGLSLIEAIEGSLVIARNTDLNDLSGFRKLQNIGQRLSITANKALTRLTGLDSLKAVGQSVRIADNASLIDLKALQGLQAVEKDLSIEANPVLNDLSGLDSLQYIKGYFIIGRNSGLSSIHGLERLLWVGETLQITENISLKSLEGFRQLERIGRDLIIDASHDLFNLKGLEQLTRIDGYLQIVNNRQLLDLQGLEGLRTIGGLFQIYNNASMRSLQGVDSIDHTSITDLALLSSPMLAVCNVKSICDYLGNAANQASISRNTMGCNSREEIRVNCDRSGTDSSPRKREVLWYPNPTFDRVFLRGKELEKAEIRVYDRMGKIIFQRPPGTDYVDLGLLSAGVYTLELIGDKERLIHSVVKIQY